MGEHGRRADRETVSAVNGNIPEKLADMLEMIASVSDRAERIEVLISLGERFKGVPDAVAARPYPEEKKVPACESEAYVFAVPRGDGTLDFHYAVENPQGISAMATAVILKDSCSGAPLDQVANVSTDIVYQIFGNELSMGKSMGLTAMVQMTTHAARQAPAA
jgi:cysteine desulfuration protein SufE